jgi:hypothetical protein
MAFRVPVYIVGLGLFCAAQGGYETLSHASLRLTGEKTTAILVDRIADCTVEYRHGQDRKMEQMPCSAAEVITRVGASDVSVFRINKAVIEFATADGLRRMSVVEKVWQTESLPLQAQIAALYRKEDPNGVVRADSMWGAMIAFIGGTLVLALAVRGWVSGGPAGVRCARERSRKSPRTAGDKRTAADQATSKTRYQQCKLGRSAGYFRLSQLSQVLFTALHWHIPAL